jgi:membrane dipeptidase
MIVLDTHLDTPANLGRPGWSIMDRHSTTLDGDQVDYPRLVEGGVDGGWFVIFTAQGNRDEAGLRAARDAALVRAVQIREMVAKHGSAFELALTADDAARIAAARKRIVYMSMENGSPLETDIRLMRTFRALGVTMMGPVHFRNNGLADSSTDKPEWNGLSPKGRAFVAEANRLGILIDASHASDESTRQMVQLSKAPIILSHTGMDALFDHPRNIPDDLAKAIAATGGVVQINAFTGYMIANAPNPERDAALREVMAGAGDPNRLTIAERRALNARRRAVEARYPVRRATFDDVMKHVLHAIRVLGIDHVGISGDFDGGGGVEGFNDISDFPKLSAALLRAGYSRAEVAKVMGGNALRVLRVAQAGAEPGAVPVVPRTL